jgi:hypothetical protein
MRSPEMILIRVLVIEFRFSSILNPMGWQNEFSQRKGSSE